MAARDSGDCIAGLLRYYRFVPSGSDDSLRLRLAGAGAVMMLGVAHGIHDVLEGEPVGDALLPTVAIVLQVAVLSLGHGVAERRGWSRRMSGALAVVVSLLFGFFIVALHPRPTEIPTGISVFWFLTAGLGVFGCWLLAYYVPAQLSAARVRTLVAETELGKAELARLRANLHPHFLLNTLNAVAGMLTVEPRQARQLVSSLGDLLRDSLEDDGAVRPLSEEVDWLRRYAEIFEIRHRGAIRFEWELLADTMTVSIPRLLLQPLMENAIEHGALKRPGGGKVSVRSRACDGKIAITVSDDGPGMGANAQDGIGLRLVRERLHLAYPDARMTIDSSPHGTTVVLELPTLGNPL